jgi:hypothetical protein
MLTQAKKMIAGTLLIATGTLASIATNVKPADAQLIGGGGTCTPHQVFYQQYVPGYYNKNGIWISSHYETRSRMSTECNNNVPQSGTIRPGQWYTDANYSGATTYIVQTGLNTYRFINEQGRVANGYVSGNKVTAPNWHVTGVIENHGDRIAWSNGTNWTRYSKQS